MNEEEGFLLYCAAIVRDCPWMSRRQAVEYCRRQLQLKTWEDNAERLAQKRLVREMG